MFCEFPREIKMLLYRQTCKWQQFHLKPFFLFEPTDDQRTLYKFLQSSFVSREHGLWL